MAVSGKISDLFIDVTLRGGGKADLIALRDKIRQADRSLENNADLYRRQTAGKLDQMTQLAAKSQKLVEIDNQTYGSKKYGKTAGAQSKAGMAQAIADQSRAIAMGNAELRLVSGVKGQELARKSLQAERIAKQVTEMKNHQKMVAEYGKFGAMMRGSGPAGAGMSVAAGAAMGTLAAVSAAAYMGLQLGKGASPVAGKTFDTSWQLLMTEIGTIFVPAVMAASKALQELAGRVNSFSNWASTEEGSQTIENANQAMMNSNPLLQALYAGGTGLASLLGVTGIGQGRPALSNTVPASYNAFEAMQEKIQLEAAGRGEAEERLYQAQMEANQIAMGVQQNTQSISEQIAAALGNAN